MPALVLGSNQDERVVDPAACDIAGVQVARRRSGGGAVLLAPGDVTWLDIIVPRGASGWEDDVHGSMIWLGRHLRDVLRDRFTTRGLDRLLEVHEERFRAGRGSDVLCFDGLGSGEVTLNGSKLVGISQRRTRHAARLQCSWYSSFDWQAALDLLVPHHRPALDELASVATVPAEIGGDIATDLARDLAARLSDARA